MLNTPDLEDGMRKEKYNELETIAEWILEDVLQLEDSIEENEEPETEQEKGSASIDFHASALAAEDYAYLTPAKELNQVMYCFSSSIPLKDLAPPPDCFVGI